MDELFQTYTVEFRIKITKGKFSTPEGAVKAAAASLINEVGIPDPSDYGIARFIRNYFHSVVKQSEDG
jgi:hypothetical protein